MPAATPKAVSLNTLAEEVREALDVLKDEHDRMLENKGSLETYFAINRSPNAMRVLSSYSKWLGTLDYARYSGNIFLGILEDSEGNR